MDEIGDASMRRTLFTRDEAALTRPAAKFVPLTVAFGPPIEFDRGVRGKAAYQAAASRMMAAIARLQEEVTGRPARWEGEADRHRRVRLSS